MQNHLYMSTVMPYTVVYPSCIHTYSVFWKNVVHELTFIFSEKYINVTSYFQFECEQRLMK